MQHPDDPDIRLPAWWDLPTSCPNGHPWGPGRVTRGWLPCGCAGGGGHHFTSCNPPDDPRSCDAIWYDPQHKPGTEHVGYPVAIPAAE